jgi:iron complex transport system substrate-binding protein
MRRPEFFAVAVAAFSLVACRGSGRLSAATAEPRVVSLHDVTTEVVVALGAVGRLVGVEEPVDASDEVRAAIAGVPRVGGLETLAAREPGVVLGLDIVRQKDPALVEALVRENKSVYLPALASVADIVAMIREVGARIGARDAAERLARRFEDEVGPVAAHADAPTRVFVYDCCDPPFTAGRRTVLSDLIARAGGENVFADHDGAWTHVSWEEVVARKPARIVVDEYRDGAGSEVEGKLAALRRWPALGSLPVTVMPLRNCLGGLGTAQGAALLRAALGGRT